jgi:hypothetical protein
VQWAHTSKTSHFRVSAKQATMLTSSSNALLTTHARKKQAVSVAPHMRSKIGKNMNRAAASIAKLKAKKGVVMSKMVLPHEGAKLIDWMTNKNANTLQSLQKKCTHGFEKFRFIPNTNNVLFEP